MKLFENLFGLLAIVSLTSTIAFAMGMLTGFGFGEANTVIDFYSDDSSGRYIEDTESRNSSCE